MPYSLPFASANGLKDFMMMRRLLKIFIFLLALSSCSEEPVEAVFKDLDTSAGVFIVCEGNFMYGNGSLSFYNDQKMVVNNQLFYAVNNVPLGDVVQSAGLFDDNLFIVVNNSGKVYIADAGSVEYRGVITGLSSPRHVHFVSAGKAYISDLYADHLTIFNPSTFEKEGTINLDGHTSEEMIQIGRFLYITSWSFEKYVLVVDTETDSLVAKIEVPYQPKDIVADSAGKVWVLSDGGFEDSPETVREPALSRIDTQTLTIEQIYRFGEGMWPSSLTIDSTGDTLYYINGGVCKMAVTDRHLPDSPFINNVNGLFYSMSVNPDNGEVYVADAIDYSQNGLILRYSKSGKLIDTFKAGVNPAGFLFR